MDIFPKYQNKAIRATKNASEELWNLEKDMWDVKEILETGYDCSTSKRKPNILERCLRKGNSIFKAVVVNCESYCLLIHFGKFTCKRR